ncbi:MAG TPA: hypothetical protein VHX65_01165 [Pirellulales bacterium]|nr:hypothetical protein [Pirellulales bacterium]
MPRSFATSLTLVAVLAMFAITALAQTPESELRAAVADVEQLPAEVRPGVRYLSLYAIPAARRPAATQVVAYTLNSLSRTRAIFVPTTMSPTLLRFSISNFVTDGREFAAWSAAWEKLVESDPYWHLPTEVAVSSGPTDPTRQAPTPTKAAQAATAAALRVTTDGGWVGLDQAAKLRSLTTSAGAILRADDFIARSTVPPAYYAFSGIPATETEFLKTLGVESETIERLRANAGANLLISGITQKPRRVVWLQGPLGGVYQTLDVQQVDANRDPIRRPLSVDGANLKFDAGEWFAVAPNGLWRTALYDAAGNRQDSVPDKIAKDTSDPLADGVVVPMISCIRCHTESGLRPFRDDQTRLLATGRVDLRSSDPTLVQRIAEFYDEPRLQRQMDFDRQTYDLAVARATDGMKADELAAALAATVREFAYLPVTPTQAARELGIDADALGDALGQSHDPILLLLVEGRQVLRGQWESSFAEAATLAESWKVRH